MAIPVIFLGRLGNARRQGCETIRCTEIHVKMHLSGDLKYILQPAAADHVVDNNLMHMETLRTISDLLPAPPPSIRLAWKSIGAGRFEVTFLLTTITTFVEHKGDYDETRDPDSLYWRMYGPLAGYGPEGCEMCGSSIPTMLPEVQCCNENCLMCWQEGLCQNCIRDVRGERWCILCLMAEEDSDEDDCISSFKQPERPYPEDTQRWLSFFQLGTMPFEILKRRNLQIKILSRCSTIQW